MLLEPETREDRTPWVRKKARRRPMALVYCARSTWRLASSGRFASICLVISSRGPFRKSGTGSAGGVGMLGEATAVRTARRGEGARAALARRAGAARGVTARAAETAWAAMSTEEERRARTPRQNVRGGSTTARAMTSRIADAWRRKLRASPPEASRGEHVTKADFHDFVRVGSQKIVYLYEAFSPYPPSFAVQTKRLRRCMLR